MEPAEPNHSTDAANRSPGMAGGLAGGGSICQEPLSRKLRPPRCPPLTDRPQTLPAFALTLAVGAAGGGLFWLLNLPAGWLAGSMLAVTAAALSGVRTWLPNWLRTTVFILIGVQLGSAVTRQTVENIGHWPVSMALMAVTVAAVTAVSFVYYRRLAGWPPITALLGGVPGAFSTVLALADAYNADIAAVAVVQCIRLFFLVAVLPLLMTAIGMHGGAVAAATAPMSPASLAVMIVAGAAGGIILYRLKVPAGLIFGAAAPAAVLKFSGLADGGLPPGVLAPAYVILGAMIGSRFSEFSLPRLKGLIGVGLGSFVLAFAVAATGAIFASSLTGISLGLTLIAFAPGGLDTMTILAFALGLDPTFVAAHQIGRYFLLAFALPMAAMWASRRSA